MKNALVTGSTRGIGASIVYKLNDSGFKTFTNSRNGGDCPADLSTLEGVKALVNNIKAKTEKLDCLVLNAGATCRKSFTEMNLDDWQIVINTNVTMPLYIVQSLFDHISEGGSIMFVSSAMALHPHAISIAYGVSKAAVNSMTQNLVKEFAPRKIRVNAICPGFIDTEWQKEKPEWLRTKIEAKTALMRFGTPDEVANMVLAIIRNDYMNGSLVSIDGGYDME